MTKTAFGNAQDNRYHNPHIARCSVPGSSSGCPVALALREDGYREVHVDLDFIMMNQRVFRAGPRLASWIQAYEEGCVENRLHTLHPERVPEKAVPLLGDAARSTVGIYLKDLRTAQDGA